MEFELNGNTYRIGKLSAVEQFHVSRRLAPIIPTLLPLLSELAKMGVDVLSKDKPVKAINPFADGLDKALAPFASCVSTMSDAHSEYILHTCLGVAKRKVGDSWVPVWNKQHGACMFEDIDLGTMVNITFRVIKDSMQAFIRGLLTSLPSSPTSQS